jgi:hypothetical protein
MKKINSKKILTVGSLFFLLFSAKYKAQWNPLWYPPPGFNSLVNSSPAVQDASPWALGGNQLPFAVSTNGYNNYACGTTDGVPFALMSSGVEMINMDLVGRVAIGANNLPSIANCVLDIKGTGGNFRIFGDAAGNVQADNTDLKLHYGPNSNGNAYSFELNQGAPGSSTARMLIDTWGNSHFFGSSRVYNNLMVGNTTFAPGGNPRLGVDARTSNGLLLVAGGGNDAISVFNQAGAGRFRMWVNNGNGQEDSKIHIGGSTQIGFTQFSIMQDLNTRLNVDARGGSLNGIKVASDWGSSNNSLLYIENVNITSANNKPFEVKGDGRTYIGYGRPNFSSTVCANAKLTVDGQILARDIRVSISTGTHWADYVFDKKYKPMPLADVEKYIQKNKHLPEIPSEADVKKDGVDLLEMNVALLKKVEELYLYTIELKKESEKQKIEIESLKKNLNK